MSKQNKSLPAALGSRRACKRKMPLRCAYKAYCLIVRDDGILCAKSDGTVEVFDTMRQAKAKIKATKLGDIQLAVARCYIVPAEMWEGA